PRAVQNFLRLFPPGIVALALMVGASVSVAEDVVFTIDPTQSTDSTSGTNGSGVGSYSSSPITGNFIVNFDPSTATPTSLKSVGDGTANFGYFQTSSTLTGQSADAAVQWQINNLSWTFASDVLNATSPGVYPVAPVPAASPDAGFRVLSGGANLSYPGGTASG